ncbi:Crp/Fnr family transcriptional regulator [Phytohabitans flavus]|uniref:Crp/Fnr family transcriptional regulator n=1 Tax=Phytohabitans flavus TaxID=1076124 RepID=A0A6F8Y676_9ACTN|nr:Crp/Fnr family transcriptional regulator [Phytohabitans flavus]BCB81595.1 Crp/Fnr family transcriptional regulator [Phytohabitans flavus]
MPRFLSPLPEAPPRWPRHSLLGALSPAARDDLLALGAPCRYPAGRRLIAQGATTRHVVVLLRGSVKVVATTESGRDVLLGLRHCGDLVGELACLDDHPRSATVTTAAPAEVRVIKQLEFLAFLDRHRDAAIVLSGSIARRLRDSTKRRVELIGEPVRTKLALVLSEFLDQTPDPIDADKPQIELTQAELASLVDASEVSVQRALSELRRMGAIMTRYRGILVHDAAALRRAAVREPVAGRTA